MLPHSWSSAKLFTSKGIGKLNLNLRTRRKWNFKMIKLNIYHPATCPTWNERQWPSIPRWRAKHAYSSTYGCKWIESSGYSSCNGYKRNKWSDRGYLNFSLRTLYQTQSKNVQFFFQSLNWRVTLNWSSFKLSTHAVCYWQKYGRVLRNGQK